MYFLCADALSLTQIYSLIMVRMFVNPDKCYDVVPKGSLVPRPHPGDVGSGHETNCRGNPIHVRDVLGKLPASAQIMPD